MKRLARITSLVLGFITLLSGSSVKGQPAPRPAAMNTGSKAGELTKFDLDFPGGTPKALVEAIQKAMGRRLNAIVPDEFANVNIPALKMEHVDVSQLFQALGAVSRKEEAYQVGAGNMRSYQISQTSYGFRQGPEDRLSDDSIWCFYVVKPAIPPSTPTTRSCRFYSLAPYLERNLTVDDITTAIETGWKMLGESPLPTISFHKDTKLLIAVGEQGKLEIIDAVLKALEPPRFPSPTSAATPASKPAAQGGE